MHVTALLNALLLALTAGIGVLPAPRQASPARIDAVAWLQGCWVMASPSGRIVEENWMAPKGGTMIGTGRTVAGNRLVEYELVLLKEDGDALAYQAHPSGQATATFRSITVTGSELVVENKEHDFPQRVGYRRDGDALNAWIEGTRGGQVRRIDFSYRRTACPGA